MNFRYRAYRKDGRSDTGEFDAASKQDALRLLAARGLSVFQLTEAKLPVTAADTDMLKISRVPFAGAHVDFSKLFADLALLTGAGLTVSQSLRSIRSTETGAAQRGAVAGLLDKMSSGAGAAASFAEVKGIPAESLAMISSGENAGRLPEVFAALAAQFEERRKMKSELLNALAYPLFLSVLMIAAILVLTFVLVPAIAPIFENSGQQAPYIVSILLNVRAGLTGGPAIGILAAAALLFPLLFLPAMRTSAAAAFQRLVLNLPLIGPVIRKLAKARYLSSFALLAGHGAPMSKALELSALSAVIPALRTKLLEVRDNVSAGEKLPAALRRSGLFDHRIVSLIAVGDEANCLPAVARRAALLLEGEARGAIARYTAVLTPIMTIIMGLLIGGLAVSVMSALLSINQIAAQ